MSSMITWSRPPPPASGANSTVVCGHDVGRFAFVAAGAVVTKHVPDFALVMGVPGRVVGFMCQCGVRLPLAPSEKARDVACADCGWKYRWDGAALREVGAAAAPR